MRRKISVRGRDIGRRGCDLELGHKCWCWRRRARWLERREGRGRRCGRSTRKARRRDSGCASRRPSGFACWSMCWYTSGAGVRSTRSRHADEACTWQHSIHRFLNYTGILQAGCNQYQHHPVPKLHNNVIMIIIIAVIIALIIIMIMIIVMSIIAIIAVIATSINIASTIVIFVNEHVLLRTSVRLCIQMKIHVEWKHQRTCLDHLTCEFPAGLKVGEH